MSASESAKLRELYDGLRGISIAVLALALLSSPLNLVAFACGITASCLLLCFVRPDEIYVEAPRISRLAYAAALFACLAAALGLVVGTYVASSVCDKAAMFAREQDYPHCVATSSGTVICYSYDEFLDAQMASCAGRRDFAVVIIIWAITIQLPLALSASILGSRAARISSHAPEPMGNEIMRL